MCVPLTLHGIVCILVSTCVVCMLHQLCCVRFAVCSCDHGMWFVHFSIDLMHVQVSGSSNCNSSKKLCIHKTFSAHITFFLWCMCIIFFACKCCRM